MKGYLMLEKEWVPGDDLFLESLSPENEFGVVLEYDGETLYLYAVERDKEGPGIRILDAVLIWQRQEEPTEAPVKLQIVWSTDWLKCALVMGATCQAVFDFEAHRGYSVLEFPPPNEIWSQGDRKLTDEIVKRLF
jgi:hypothetical protein